MKTHKDIEKEIDDIFDSIEEAKVSHFFKDKTMQRLFSEKRDERIAFAWFTPKLQLATLVGVIVLNVFAFKQLDQTTSTYDDEVDEFAETYGLSADTETLLLN